MEIAIIVLLGIIIVLLILIMLVGDRQQIKFDLFKTKYPFINTMINLWDIFCNNNVEEALQNMKLPKCTQQLIKAMEVRFGKKY